MAIEPSSERIVWHQINHRNRKGLINLVSLAGHRSGHQDDPSTGFREIHWIGVTFRHFVSGTKYSRWNDIAYWYRDVPEGLLPGILGLGDTGEIERRIISQVVKQYLPSPAPI